MGARKTGLFDFWFRPHRFETERLYERLGARLLKRYVPTGGDLVMRWVRRRHPGFRLVGPASLESLRRFERWTRVAESVHEVGFVAFAALAAWRLIDGSLHPIGFGVASFLDLTLGLWPVTLQRYNRVRATRAIKVAARIAVNGHRLSAGSQPSRRQAASSARPRRMPSN